MSRLDAFSSTVYAYTLSVLLVKQKLHFDWASLGQRNIKSGALSLLFSLTTLFLQTVLTKNHLEGVSVS